MANDSDNAVDTLSVANGPVHGEIAVGAWDSLVDPNFKDRNDGLGSGSLHRKGTNFKPVKEDEILRQRYKLPNPERKTKQGMNTSNFSNPDRDARPTSYPNYKQQQPKPYSRQNQPHWGKPADSSHPPLTPSSSRGAASESPETPKWGTQKPWRTPRQRDTSKDNNSSTYQPAPKARPPPPEKNAWVQGNLVSEPFWDKPKPQQQQEQQQSKSSAAEAGENKAQSRESFQESANAQPQSYTMTSSVLSQSSVPRQIPETANMNETMSMTGINHNQDGYGHGASYYAAGTNYSQNSYAYGGTYNPTATATTSPNRDMPNMMSNNQEQLHPQQNQFFDYRYNTSQPLPLPQYQHSASLQGFLNHTIPSHSYSDGGAIPPVADHQLTFSNPVVAIVNVMVGSAVQAHVSIKMYDNAQMLAKEVCLSHNIYDAMTMKQLELIFNAQQLAGIQKRMIR